MRSLIRTLGFFSKETTSVLRQPRLLGAFVLGPFIILLVFGLGFRGHHPELRAVVVVPDEPSVSDDPEMYRGTLTDPFKLKEVTRDEQHARALLARNDADVVLVVHADVVGQISSGSSAPVAVLYNEADPTQSAWLRYFAYVEISELNRRLLTEVLRRSKAPVSAGRPAARCSPDWACLLVGSAPRPCLCVPKARGSSRNGDARRATHGSVRRADSAVAEAALRGGPPGDVRTSSV